MKSTIKSYKYAKWEESLSDFFFIIFSKLVLLKTLSTVKKYKRNPVPIPAFLHFHLEKMKFEDRFTFKFHSMFILPYFNSNLFSFFIKFQF